MEYFHYLSEIQKDNIFFKRPAPMSKNVAREQLAYAVGAALYMPAIRKDIASMIIHQKYKEAVTIVLDLEDAIGDNYVEEAIEQTVSHLLAIEEAMLQGQLNWDSLPLLFIRVRSANQLKEVANKLGTSIHYLTGFVFPKFSTSNGREYLHTLRDVEMSVGTRLYGMPILESSELFYKETRYTEFQTLSVLLKEYESSILNVRIGATDLCGLYGIRRSSQSTIYDISVMRDFISDVVNYFGRSFVISGPVWEYFNNQQELREHEEQIVSYYNTGLLNETLLDLTNGLIGKTVIHPSHLKVVQSVNVVSQEEYLDALSILENANGDIGVLKSNSQNKMNEIKPHYKWAVKVMTKSTIYGVYHDKYNFFKILTEAIPYSDPIGYER
ncbi:HpcH/HpaI aldolase/citrate lyase family protein [Bacillus sp. RAR_GA_16]|uniref:HpcH/HpaI aldolase/citrate lyase family protein n=1 Tax=Bacillus sp. RAR_GA_16 TaxID=2876774 RepID=UPI001CCD6310|nr:HpcH/HpaI aldolase/citrate lyase family protein [Bacillus sp. RAR_GA_16]MCA0173641.1 HpcH/HpaI aldolase/citrate lyase family protein [Bacillus sp. RAR_GA_16]